MLMAWLLHLGAHFDRLDPRIVHNLLHVGPKLGIRFQNAAQQGASFAWPNVVDRRRERGHVFSAARPAIPASRRRDSSIRRGDGHLERRSDAGSLIRREKRVRKLCYSPWKLLKQQAVVHNPNRPNIDQACVIRCLLRPKIDDISYITPTSRIMDSRFRRNCSGAMYGSLPQRPVDMCTVVSHGSLYTVDAP